MGGPARRPPPAGDDESRRAREGPRRVPPSSSLGEGALLRDRDARDGGARSRGNGPRRPGARKAHRRDDLPRRGRDLDGGVPRRDQLRRRPEAAARRRPGVQPLLLLDSVGGPVRCCDPRRQGGRPRRRQRDRRRQRRPRRRRGGPARGRARACGNGPFLLECKTYRRKGHAEHDGQAYVDRDEPAEWSRRDPIALFERQLEERSPRRGWPRHRPGGDRRRARRRQRAEAEASPAPASTPEFRGVRADEEAAAGRRRETFVGRLRDGRPGRRDDAPRLQCASRSPRR